jgi:hypothetical protein
MKRIILAISFGIITIGASAFTGNDKAAIPSSFYSTFGNVQQVQSEWVKGMIRVSFIRDQHASFAYYDVEGNLLVSSTQLRVNELPNSLQEELIIYYNDWFVVDTYKCDKDGAVDYFVVLKKDGKEKVMKGKGRWRKIN